MKYKGAVFFDYDGTLADEREGVYFPTPLTLKAAQRLRENGYLAVLATGRAKCYLPPNTGIDFDGYITTNGAYAEIEGKCVHCRYFDEALLREAMTYMDAHQLGYALESQAVCYAKNLSDPSFLAVLKNFKIPEQVFVPLTQMKEPKINKLFVTSTSFDAEDDFIKTFDGRLSMKRHRFCTSWDVDIFGVTKADGVQAVMDAFHFSRDQLYAFGDGANDYTMLKLVGHGIAMKEHAACLEETAEFITGSVKDEGIYQGLTRLGLI